MYSPPISSVGKRRVGTRSLVLVGSGTSSAKYVLLASCLGYDMRQVRHSPFQHVKQWRCLFNLTLRSALSTGISSADG